MKKNTLPAALTSLCCALGILCLAARYWLLTTGVDQTGLLVTSHPGNILSWTLSAVAVAAVAVTVLWKKPRCMTERSPLSFVGAFCAVIAYGYMAFSLPGGNTLWYTLSFFLALASALCTALHTLLWIRGKQPSVLLRCVPVAFYAVFMLYCYQQWTAVTQLQSYGFQLLALIFLMLSVYHRAALEVSQTGSRRYLAVSCGALFFCLAAIPGAPMGLFYLLIGLSTLLDGCRQVTGE